MNAELAKQGVYKLRLKEGSLTDTGLRVTLTLGDPPVQYAEFVCWIDSSLDESYASTVVTED